MKSFYPTLGELKAALEPLEAAPATEKVCVQKMLFVSLPVDSNSHLRPLLPPGLSGRCTAPVKSHYPSCGLHHGREFQNQGCFHDFNFAKNNTTDTRLSSTRCRLDKFS